MVRLAPEQASFTYETDRLIALLASIVDIAPNYRKLIAEIILIRLSFLLENHLKLIFAKLACGASYMDGSTPQLLVTHRTMAAALAAMQNLNRPRLRYLIWNDGAEIRENIVHIMQPSDDCNIVLRTYAPYLTELRYVRNYIAHRNEGTRKNFRSVIRRFYGAALPGITSGTLLLSRRASNPPLVEVHIRTSRVLIKDLLKA
jgi:hypothetical protein